MVNWARVCERVSPRLSRPGRSARAPAPTQSSPHRWHPRCSPPPCGVPSPCRPSSCAARRPPPGRRRTAQLLAPRAGARGHTSTRPGKCDRPRPHPRSCLRSTPHPSCVVRRRLLEPVRHRGAALATRHDASGRCIQLLPGLAAHPSAGVKRMSAPFCALTPLFRTLPLFLIPPLPFFIYLSSPFAPSLPPSPPGARARRTEICT